MGFLSNKTYKSIILCSIRCVYSTVHNTRKRNISIHLTPERHEDREHDCTGPVECRGGSPPVLTARVHYPRENAIAGVTPPRRTQNPIRHWRFMITNIATKHVEIKPHGSLSAFKNDICTYAVLEWFVRFLGMISCYRGQWRVTLARVFLTICIAVHEVTHYNCSAYNLKSCLMSVMLLHRRCTLLFLLFLTYTFSAANVLCEILLRTSILLNPGF